MNCCCVEFKDYFTVMIIMLLKNGSVLIIYSRNRVFSIIKNKMEINNSRVLITEGVPESEKRQRNNLLLKVLKL
jgi:hypothetical protein